METTVRVYCCFIDILNRVVSNMFLLFDEPAFAFKSGHNAHDRGDEKSTASRSISASASSGQEVIQFCRFHLIFVYSSAFVYTSVAFLQDAGTRQYVSSSFQIFHMDLTVLGLGSAGFSASIQFVRDDALAHCVENFNTSVFHDGTFLPKFDFKAGPLFGYKSYLDSDDPGMENEYQYSCRALVNLLTLDCELDFKEARDGLSSFVLDLLLARLGDQAPTKIKAMSLLLQVPFGGECQVWHTDEDHDDEEVVYSILIPCHRQSAPVFLETLDSKTGPSGVKPELSLGDMVYWHSSLVTHAGSSADLVPPGQLLRAAVFISVGIASRKDASAQIWSGPDADQWKQCIHPIIRSCVRCRRGVQACEPNMKFCRTCLGSGVFQAKAVLCRFCHESDDHLHCDTSLPDGGSTGISLLRYLWQGLGLEFTAIDDGRLCIHGNKAFEDLSSPQRLLVHFHEDELQRGFQFWSDFFVHFAPDETIFTEAQRGGKEEYLWNFFYLKFVVRGGKGRCLRSLGILGVTSMICGFSSLVWRDDTSSGSIPVFMAEDNFATHSAAYVDAYRVANSNKDGLVLRQDDDRIARALDWLESKCGTTHCSCKSSEETPRGITPLSHHHQIQECPGPTFNTRSQIVSVQSPGVRAVWTDVFILRGHEQGIVHLFQCKFRLLDWFSNLRKFL